MLFSWFKCGRLFSIAGSPMPWKKVVKSIKAGILAFSISSDHVHGVLHAAGTVSFLLPSDTGIRCSMVNFQSSCRTVPT